LRGGSFPEQLAEVAADWKCGDRVLDRNGVYGAQRFSVLARSTASGQSIGAELSMEDGSILPVLVKIARLQKLVRTADAGHLRSGKR